MGRWIGKAKKYEILSKEIWRRESKESGEESKERGNKRKRAKWMTESVKQRHAFNKPLHQSHPINPSLRQATGLQYEPSRNMLPVV